MGTDDGHGSSWGCALQDRRAVAGLMTYRNNVVKLTARARGLIRAGKSQEEVAKVMTAEYGWAPNSLAQQWSVPGMMKELK